MKTKVKPTTWKNIYEGKAEELDIKTVYKGFSTHGRSTVHIVCPFCNKETKAYIWSWSGSGKRCEYDNCKAMLGKTRAWKVR